MRHICWFMEDIVDFFSKRENNIYISSVWEDKYENERRKIK